MSQDKIRSQPVRSMRTMPSKAVADPHSEFTVPSVPVSAGVTQRIRSVVYRQPPLAQRMQPQPPAQREQARRNSAQTTSTSYTRWMFGGLLAVAGIVVLGVIILSVIAMISYSNGILPGVEVAGVDVGGLSVDEAENVLGSQWQQIILQDGERRWTIEPGELGLQLNAAETAKAAYERGRGSGNVIAALFGTEQVAPQFSVEEASLQPRLTILAEHVGLPAKNAGVAVVNGIVEATPPQNGRQLDIAAAADLLMHAGAQTLSDGVLELPMVAVAPHIHDATPMLETARALLSNPLVVRLYDPVTGDIVDWTQSPENWATWLTATSRETGFTLTADVAAVRAFLVDQARALDNTRYLKFDEAAEQIQKAISSNNTRPTIRVYHHDRMHTVASGDSIIGIAWDYGVPYPWIQQANPGVDHLIIGQTITIPSPDNFLPFEVMPDKRIVVSISQQHVWVYENGALKWDWVASTGINSSPTWPGIYQVISHVPNAYAANWDLYMPQFIGVYQPIPGSAFTNGFHGFPTRGGGQLLWENSLGTRVTYGCILLSNASVQLLYDWAEEGVVVEIQP